MATSKVIHFSRYGDASGRSACGKYGVWISSANLFNCKSCMKVKAFLDRLAEQQAAEEEQTRLQFVFEQVKQRWADSQVASCRNCDARQDSDTGVAPCEQADDGGEHEWDMHLHEPSSAYPLKQIKVQFELTVPQDGYDYFVDVAGRLEQVASLMLLHPMVSTVETSGPSGSGYVPAPGERERVAVTA